jgi:hypothetical protein
MSRETRYELEAKQKKRTGNIDPEALLCAFIERHGLLASSIDTEIHRQKTYSPKDLQTTITAAKK